MEQSYEEWNEVDAKEHQKSHINETIIVEGVVDIPEPKTCRICLMEDQLDDLLSPCECMGSMEYVHPECLRKWMSNKVTVKNNNKCTTLSWKKFECEVCKTPFPHIKGDT